MEPKRFPKASQNLNEIPTNEFVDEHFPGALKALEDIFGNDSDVTLFIDEEGHLLEDSTPLYWDGESWDELGPTG